MQISCVNSPAHENTNIDFSWLKLLADSAAIVKTVTFALSEHETISGS